MEFLHLDDGMLHGFEPCGPAVVKFAPVWGGGWREVSAVPVALYWAEPGDSGPVVGAKREKTAWLYEGLLVSELADKKPSVVYEDAF